MIHYKVKAIAILTLFALAYSNTSRGQQAQADSVSDIATQIRYTQPFEIDSDKIVNSRHLKDFSQEVDSIMRVDTITHVDINGIASIDGPESLNERLARARAVAMKKWLLETTTLPEDIIFTTSNGEDWKMFRALVEADPNIPAQKEVLRYVDSRMSLTAKEGGIKSLENGQTWKYLAQYIFPKMRCAEITLDVKHRYIVPIPEEILVEEVETMEVIENIPEPSDLSPEPSDLTPQTSTLIPEPSSLIPPRRFYIKTDLPYWLMSWANLAFEVDFAHHWSFNLPIYFSAVNYFKRDIKFRTFSFQPGVRYWLKPDNTGVYFEAHYGMGWWNFAFGGDYRYQDHFRKTPTMGGGVAAGYRLPISSNGRWAMEFGGGVGVYRLNYDRFQNRPDGKLIDSRKKTVFFIDNVNVSISYSFPIEKKKGGAE